MIQIYTGEGKGKTTAGLGAALRALGWGKRVCLIQFLKKGSECGELKALSGFKNCECVRFGRGELLSPRNVQPVDYQEARKGLERAEEVLRERKADILILDEVNFALHVGLLELEAVRALIRNCPREVELILTGRRCPEELFKLADYVSDIREIKHPGRKGMKAREGIEY